MKTGILRYPTHFAAFVAFAKNEPLEREIDHDGWCHCAVGNYHAEATSEPPKGEDENLVSLVDSQSPLLEELKKNHSYIYVALSYGRVPEQDESGFHISSYGGLAEFMQEYENVDIEDRRCLRRHRFHRCLIVSIAGVPLCYSASPGSRLRFAESGSLLKDSGLALSASSLLSRNSLGH